MPLMVERLNQSSPPDAIDTAIQSTIQKLISEGKTPGDAAGQAYSMAEDQTGKTLRRK